MAVAPRHELLRRVIEQIRDIFAGMAMHNNRVSPLHTTGPGVWSNAIHAYLLEQFGVHLGHGAYSMDRLMKEFVNVGDSVLLLPMRAFALNSGGYTLEAGHSVDDVLVRHNFMGSWKAEPRNFASRDGVEMHCFFDALAQEEWCCRECAEPPKALADPMPAATISARWLQVQPPVSSRGIRWITVWARAPVQRDMHVFARVNATSWVDLNARPAPAGAAHDGLQAINLTLPAHPIPSAYSIQLSTAKPPDGPGGVQVQKKRRRRNRSGKAERQRKKNHSSSSSK